MIARLRELWLMLEDPAVLDRCICVTVGAWVGEHLLELDPQVLTSILHGFAF